MLLGLHLQGERADSKLKIMDTVTEVFFRKPGETVCIQSIGVNYCMSWFKIQKFIPFIKKKHPDEDIPFNSDKQIPVIRCSICTGEQMAGFKSKDDGHFTEVMLIKDTGDLEKFKEIYKIDEIKKEY